ncbi:unnamed protein product, partial [marine sediment metagenome]
DNKMKSVAEITRNIAHAIGTSQYIKHSLNNNIVFTDGVNQLRQDADAFWLVDAIASHRRKEEFQVWELEVFSDKTAILTMKEDSGCPNLVEQKIHYTDFPLESIKFYIELGSIDGVNPVYVLMLPSER